jgi:hypothetical protein
MQLVFFFLGKNIFLKFTHMQTFFLVYFRILHFLCIGSWLFVIQECYAVCCNGDFFSVDDIIIVLNPLWRVLYRLWHDLCLLINIGVLYIPFAFAKNNIIFSFNLTFHLFFFFTILWSLLITQILLIIKFHIFYYFYRWK